MEFIACLEQARLTEGLTPSNYGQLENVFKNTVGDKKEIDIEDFKKIVQSKNMFFVERLFKIFDADNSGTVSLEEFMKVMWCFSQQCPESKLRYLFQVYDLNDDGTIQFSELRNVIRECMNENGLAFTEYEIDELTKMLFDDADTDGSGSITFNEFQDQLRRHPTFMENLTLSIERCILPPKSPYSTQQLFTWFRPRKLQWKHIKNNWTSVVFLLMYFFLNVGLFTYNAVQYSDRNSYVVVARGCGQCLNFNCMFVLVLVLRQSLTWLRTNGFAVYLPIDQHLYYHKVTGCAISGFSFLHTIMHICNFSVLSETTLIPLHKWLFSTDLNVGWVNGSACITGWILLIILIAMLFSALPCVRRSGKFEVFYCFHQLALIFWLCLILHAPNFWKWFLAPVILYVIEIGIRLYRNFFSSKRAYVRQGILLPSKVTQLVIKRPPKFDFKPGDYVYINIPTIAKFEWHPFTISSAPEMEDVLWLHIRGVGEWTNSLHKFFDRQDKEAVLSDELARNLQSISEVPADIIIHPPSETSMLNISTSTVFPISPLSARSIRGDIQLKNLLARSVSDVSGIKNPAHDTFCVYSPTCSPSNRSIHAEHEIHRHVSTEGQSSPFKNQLYIPRWNSRKKTSFGSTSSSRAVQQKNLRDAQNIINETHRTIITMEEAATADFLRPPTADGHAERSPKDKRRSVRVSVAHRGLRRCQTVIVMPALQEDDEDENCNNSSNKAPIIENIDDLKEIEREGEVENVVVTESPLKIFLDGPYGSPTRHIFQARHAVLIATGIGVTPFASILQSIMFRYRKSRHVCPKCSHRWTDCNGPVSNVQLRKVDFFWLNRHQKAFEWFVSLLSELEIQQAQLHEKDRFLDIHMYITSALKRTDMKAVGLQMALDLLYQKEKRCLITGLKSRTQPGRPNWSKVFTEIRDQNKGKVTVFFCGPPQLAKTLHSKCNEFGFRFRKEIF